MGCAKKCLRPGPITKNGYLNFLREFRKKRCGLSAVEAVCAGASAWNRLTLKQKKKYVDMAEVGGRRRKRGKCGVRRKPKRKRCAKKKVQRCRKSSPKRKRCMKLGPVTSNPFLNYLRFFKKRNCGMSPKELVKKAAKCWCNLPEGKKRRYQRMACKVSKSCRKRNSKLCRSFRKRRR